MRRQSGPISVWTRKKTSVSSRSSAANSTRRNGHSRSRTQRLACLRISPIEHGNVGQPSGEWSVKRNTSRKGRTHASWSPTSRRPNARPRNSMNRMTADAVRWRTVSRNNNCACSRTGRVAKLFVPTNCDIGLRLAERASRTRTSGDRAKNAWCDTIRTKLLKIGAAVTITVRKVWVQLASACPYHQVFADAWKNLCDGKTSCGSVTPNRPATRQVRMESSSRLSVTMP